MNLARLQRSDVLALVLGFVLLVTMSLTWYGNTQIDDARRGVADPRGAQGGEVQRQYNEAFERARDEGEKNAWRADGGIDRLILVVLLGVYVLALLSAYLRAAGKRPTPPTTPAALGAILAGAGGVLVAYRIVQEPGFDALTTVKVGAPLTIVVLGTLALALATAYRGEESGAAWARMDRADKEAAEREAEQQAEPEQPAAPTT